MGITVICWMLIMVNQELKHPVFRYKNNGRVYVRCWAGANARINGEKGIGKQTDLFVAIQWLNTVLK